MNQIEVYHLIETHYKNNFKRLVNASVGKTGNRYNAEDAVQEAYTRALTYWESFDPETNVFEAWFDKILNNSIRNLNSDVRSKGMANPDNIDPVNDNPTFFNRCLKEIKEDVDALPKEKKEVVSLSFLNGWSPLEISQITNKTVNSVRTMLFRYREEIKKKYGARLYR